MNATKLVIAVCMAMTAFAGLASAHGPYTVNKGALAPGATDVSGGAVIGVAACYNPVAASPFFCGRGLGAFFDVSRDANPLTEAPLECGLHEDGDVTPSCFTQTQHHHHPFATGTCKVSGPNPGIGTNFFWSCGVDRNNDGFVSDAPVCDAEDPRARGNGPPLAPVPHVTESLVTLLEECTGQQPFSAWERVADDWVEGCYVHGGSSLTCSTAGNSDSRPFCFQDNVRGFTDGAADDTGLPGGDISALNQHVAPVEHGDGWTEVVFFVGAPVPDTASAVGSLSVELQIEGAASCGGGVVSGEHFTGGNSDTDGNNRSTPECSDGIDNLDPDFLIDADDFQCHFDGDRHNPASYTPAHNAE